MRWFTADLHLGHHNIITYCARPFPVVNGADIKGDAAKGDAVEAMNETLIDGWNEMVAPTDEVWVLGDFAMGGLAEHLPLAGRLHGRKTLVPGNHDACWVGRRKGVDRWSGEYLSAGFDAIVQPTTTIDVAGRTVLVDHFPYEGDSGPVDRYVEHRPLDGGGWLLHGHVHDRWRQRGRQINVGVDAWGGVPVSETCITELIAAGPRDLEPLRWVR